MRDARYEVWDLISTKSTLFRRVRGEGDKRFSIDQSQANRNMIPRHYLLINLLETTYTSYQAIRAGQRYVRVHIIRIREGKLYVLSRELPRIFTTDSLPTNGSHLCVVITICKVMIPSLYLAMIRLIGFGLLYYWRIFVQHAYPTWDAA